MRKTSVYLEDGQAEQLRRTAELEGRSQAEVLRDAVAEYASRAAGSRDFALARLAHSARASQGKRGSISDVPDRELMKGFGWDSLGPEQQRKFAGRDRRRARVARETGTARAG